MEESHSGLVGATGNRVLKGLRGFESHLLRQSPKSPDLVWIGVSAFSFQPIRPKICASNTTLRSMMSAPMMMPMIVVGLRLTSLPMIGCWAVK